MTMKNPPHPGRSIRSAWLEPLGLSISEGAKILGVTRQALNNVIAGRSAISPEMAIRLTKGFGSTEETWLRMQLAYDLAAARKDERKIKVPHQPVPQELHMQGAAVCAAPISEWRRGSSRENLPRPSPGPTLRFSLRSLRLCEKLFFQPIDDACDAILDQHHVEVDQQAKSLVGQT